MENALVESRMQATSGTEADGLFDLVIDACGPAGFSVMVPDGLGQGWTGALSRTVEAAGEDIELGDIEVMRP